MKNKQNPLLVILLLAVISFTSCRPSRQIEADIGKEFFFSVTLHDVNSTVSQVLNACGSLYHEQPPEIEQIVMGSDVVEIKMRVRVRNSSSINIIKTELEELNGVIEVKIQPFSGGSTFSIQK